MINIIMITVIMRNNIVTIKNDKQIDVECGEKTRKKNIYIYSRSVLFSIS